MIDTHGILMGLVLLATPDVQRDGMESVKTWAHAREEEAARDFSASGGIRAQSPVFWGDEVVYGIVVDRFNDGNPANNNTSLQLSDVPNQRHGGDLAGIAARLDYIKNLGASTLWVTPVFRHDGSYHGYCTTDPTHVDAGFGTNEGLRTLVAQAHARDMRVVLDIVVNHLCDTQTYYSVQPEHTRCAERREAENWLDMPSSGEGAGALTFGPDFFGPLRSQHFYNRCGANPWSDTASEGAASVYGDFVPTMFDFDTRNRDWQEIFTALHTYWIGYADIDGFRMDAAKHVTEDFVAYFSTETRRYAAALGKDNFFVVGEVAANADWVGRRLGRMFSDPTNPDLHGSLPRSATRTLWELRHNYTQQAPYPGVNAVFDFANSSAARDVLLGQRPTQWLEQTRTSLWQRTLDAQGDPRLHWTHLEIHDWPRFISGEPHNPWKSALGLAYLAVAPGIPIIHYGQEQGFNGDCHWDSMHVGDATDAVRALCKSDDHARNRQDMFMTGPWRLGSSVDSVDALAGIGHTEPRSAVNWQNDPMLQRDHDIYRTTQRMLALRHSCVALRRGSWVPRWADPQGAGLVAFSRVDGEQELLVVINTLPVRVALPNMGLANTRLSGVLADVLGDNGITASVVPGMWGPYVTFDGASIDGNTMHVFTLPQALGPWQETLQIRLCQQPQDFN